MTFALENGLEVRIPNSQFLVPYVEVAENGSRTLDTSKRELLITSTATQAATIGRYFLTAAYLMVNLDEGTFTLWQANPTSRSTLVSVTGPKNLARCGNDSVGGNPTGGGGENPQSTVPVSPESNKLPTSTVAGVAVGSVAAVGLVAGVFFCIWRSLKRRERDVTSNGTSFAQQTGHLQGSQQPAKTTANDALPTPSITQNLSTTQRPVLEMDAQEDTVFEMEGSTSQR